MYVTIQAHCHVRAAVWHAPETARIGKWVECSNARKIAWESLRDLLLDALSPVIPAKRQQQ
jgi:hypothetical protein